MGVTEFDPPDVLEPLEIAAPQAGTGEVRVRVHTQQAVAERLAEPVEVYTRGQLAIDVGATFLLNRAAEAHTEIETGHGGGKSC